MTGEQLSRERPADARRVIADEKLIGWVWPETIVKGAGPHSHWRLASKRGERDYVSPYAFPSMRGAAERLAAIRHESPAAIQVED